ncbi:uncharacterized protein CANTADRAFT_44926 [Suhomyces tanzawaensis NRRL Y-17324]|uniref:G1/S-specific cyclin n=1 Tax=Suhomyces tanzawaensis NRRL Y-17324 TaxID=984487 RepID=A0A1E4SQ60_9ASCO|nr:uncharacterized protein CANTADRAFT_44926 [Suhomyces tanzawaensis NRRL Y-17324]ODV81646.1 hypothetical protein CANTADRAFT_44926 [Suhomyces tanzawaensis NRRL Y-17324]
MLAHKKYGPPPVRPKPYSIMLELLEAQANKKLTSEYTHDITLALARLEAVSQVNPAMIDLQPEIQWFMRPFLLDFLIELHSSFKLQPQTLFLCLNVIDRYCAKRIVFKRHYQLVGCTALWIAAKYEDKKLRVPTLKELTIMCRSAYDEEMFIQMEMHILSTLEWSLSHPNLEDCLQLAISHSNLAATTTPCKYNKSVAGGPGSPNSSLSAITVVGRFLCELSLYDKFFLSMPTSLVSITANLLACSMLQIPNASESLRDLMRRTLHKKPPPPAEDDMYDDSGSENRQPEVHGAFLSGLDENALQQIKKIALVFIIQFSKTTEVLSKKYENLGVIQVINNFHQRFTYVISSVYESQQSVMDQEVLDPKLVQLSEILLQFPQSEVQMDLRGQQPTSQYSVFSNKRSSSVCVTPVHSNSLASVSSATSSIVRNSKRRISKGKPSNYTASYNSNIAKHNHALPPPPPHRLTSTANSSTEFSPLNANSSGTSESTAWPSPVMHV